MIARYHREFSDVLSAFFQRNEDGQQVSAVAWHRLMRRFSGAVGTAIMFVRTAGPRALVVRCGAP